MREFSRVMRYFTMNINHRIHLYIQILALLHIKKGS